MEGAEDGGGSMGFEEGLDGVGHGGSFSRGLWRGRRG
jgi:hypothetical protein